MTATKTKTKTKTKTTKPAIQAPRPRAPNQEDAIQHAYEGILLVGFSESNQQGDVNANGHPRVDPVTGHARLSGTAVPRKIRNMWSYEGHEILHLRDEYMTRSGDGDTLTIDDMIQRVRDLIGLGLAKTYVEARSGKGAKGGSDALSATQAQDLRRAVIDFYKDIRFFGAMLNVGSDKLDNVRGAVRIQTARSISPVMPIQDALTRGMITSENERKDRGQLIGNRTTLPYALFPVPFSVIPAYAREVGFKSEHLRELLVALIYCFANDQSAVRRGVVHGLWLFQSPTYKIKRPLGRDWPDTVINIKPKIDDPIAIRHIDDYDITTDAGKIPSGVRMFTLEDIDALVEDPAVFYQTMT